jgi:cyanobactin maturation PatA/PatG family protease
MDVAAIPGLNDLWAETLGDERVCIAVLDGAVELTQRCLTGAKLTQIETLASGARTSGATALHGTHVASVIFGQHAGPVKGIAPGCRGLVAPIFTDVVGQTPVPCSQIDLARVLLQVFQAGANIINISGGQFSPSGKAHPILADAVRACVRGGVLIVAAAGNQGCDCLHIPGALPAVLAVGAMNAQGEPLPFSNWGIVYQSQGILAPGENILGAVPGGGTITGSGTSFATPIVTGVAALLLSLQLKRGQKPDTVPVRHALLRSAVGCEAQPIAECQRLLAGRLDVRGAVSILTGENRSMPDPTTQTGRSSETPVDSQLASDSVQLPSGTVGQSDSSPPVAAKPWHNPWIAAERGLPTGQIAPSKCVCGAGTSAPQLVYALGQFGYDFGTEARRDAFIQRMDKPAPGVTPNPFDPNQLLNHLEHYPWDAASLIWTLSIDGSVIYAVMPEGAFAIEGYQRLRQFLKEQLPPVRSERASVPGVLSGKVRLLNGQVVPVILPEIGGLYNWTTEGLVQTVVGGPLPDTASAQDKEAWTERQTDLREFLARVYFEHRNLGITPQERAINHAGTNAFTTEKVYESAAKEKMDLDSIEVERSPICRPESDCWDVKLFFFFPDRQVQTVRKVYRFTVDVSDIVPVTVGLVRSWFTR